MSAKPMAFILMPFDPDFDDVYSDLIKPTLEAAGFEVKRADSLLNQQNILKDVVQGIVQAQLIIADVTELNENVLYELGLAHALGKKTAMITQNIDELPFDLRPYRAVPYSVRFSRADQFRTDLRTLADGTLDESLQFSNPVLDFAPGTLASSAQVSPVARETTGEGEEPNAAVGGDEAEEELGFLDRIVALESSVEEITEVASRIGRKTEQVGEAVENRTQQLERAHERLGDRAAGAVLSIAREAAQDIESYARSLEPEAKALSREMVTFVEGADALATYSVIDSEETAQQAREFADQLSELEANLAESQRSMGEFAESMLGVSGMSKDLTRAVKASSRVVNDIATTMESSRSELTRTRNLLEERIQRFEAA
jgi:hypothetical protein